jgi:hypothetical protein
MILSSLAITLLGIDTPWTCSGHGWVCLCVEYVAFVCVGTSREAAAWSGTGMMCSRSKSVCRRIWLRHRVIWTISRRIWVRVCVCANLAEEAVVAVASNGSRPRRSALRGNHGAVAGVSRVPGLYEAPVLFSFCHLKCQDTGASGSAVLADQKLLFIFNLGLPACVSAWAGEVKCELRERVFPAISNTLC